MFGGDYIFGQEKTHSKMPYIIFIVIGIIILFYCVEEGYIQIFYIKKTDGEDSTPIPQIEEQQTEEKQEFKLKEEDQVELYELKAFKIKTTVLNGEEIRYSYIVFKSPVPLKIREEDVGIVFNGKEERVLKIKEIEKDGTYYYVIYFQVDYYREESTVEVFWKDKHFTLTAPTVIEKEEDEQFNYEEFIFEKLLPNENTDNNEKYPQSIVNVEKNYNFVYSTLNSYYLSTKISFVNPVIAESAFTSNGYVFYARVVWNDRLDVKALCDRVVRTEGFKITAEYADEEQISESIEKLIVRRETCIEDGGRVKVYVEFNVNDKTIKKSFTVNTIYSYFTKTFTVEEDVLYVLIDNFLYRIDMNGDIKKVQFTTRTGVLTAFVFKDSNANPIIIWSDDKYTYYFKYSLDLSKALVKKRLTGKLVRAGWTEWESGEKFAKSKRIYVIVKDNEGFKTLILNQETNEIVIGWYDALIPVFVETDIGSEIQEVVKAVKMLSVKTDNYYLTFIPVQTNQYEAHFYVILDFRDSGCRLMGAKKDNETALKDVKEHALKFGVKLDLYIVEPKLLSFEELEELKKSFTEIKTA